MKTCSACDQALPVSSFYKKLDGTTARCKECTKASRRAPAARAKAAAYMATWREQNPGRVALANKVYQRRNLDKFAEYSRRYFERVGGRPKERRGQWEGPPKYLVDGRYFETTARDLARLRARQGGRCAACHSPLAGDEHLDHIIPLARGGRHSIGNVQFLCPACNLTKSDRLYADFRRDMKEAI